MPELRIDVGAALALADELDQVAAALAQHLAAARRAAAEDTLAQARHAILSGGRSGRLYRRRGALHRASAPGEPPASITGRLALSLALAEATDAVVVASEVDYARYLELGTRHLAPRPFLGPAAAATEDALAAAVGAAVDRSLEPS